MSQMRIFKILENGDLQEFTWFGNGGRGALLLWDWFAKKYFPEKGEYPMIFWKKEEQDRFWELVNDPALPEHERITLYHTYDRVMVKKENIPRLTEAFESTGKQMEDPGHLLDQAVKLKELTGMVDVIGVCWQQTTVNADAWGSEGVIYDDDDNSRPFNIFKDKYHGGEVYWLFDEFDEVKEIKEKGSETKK